MSISENDRENAKPLALAVLTDIHFWVPFLVLLLGVAVLAICAQS